MACEKRRGSRTKRRPVSTSCNCEIVSNVYCESNHSHHCLYFASYSYVSNFSGSVDWINLFLLLLLLVPTENKRSVLGVDACEHSLFRWPSTRTRQASTLIRGSFSIPANQVVGGMQHTRS
jgi:hypothetical protein